MIVLYDKPECPFCYRVRVALAFLGVDYELRAYDTEENQQQWSALTPGKTVPIMVDGDLVIYESAVMLEYLQDKFGGLNAGRMNHEWTLMNTNSLMMYAFV